MLNIELPCSPEILFLSMYLRERKTGPQRDLYFRVPSSITHNNPGGSDRGVHQRATG